MRVSFLRRVPLIAVAIVAIMAAPVFAVLPAGTLSATTLNGAITINATTLVLTSASASAGSTLGAPAVGHCLYVDKELMRITAVSSTTMTVIRATSGAAPHATSAIVITGPCGQGGTNGGFRNADPQFVVGSQDCSTWINPWINTTTGDVWWCDQAGTNAGIVSVTNPITRNGTAGSRRVAQ